MTPSNCLSLSENPLRFEPLRKMTMIFYDDKSNEISTVISSEDGMQIVVENTVLRKKNIFSIKHNRRVISLKFSPDQQILAVQHDKGSVDFISFRNCVQSSSFTQTSKLNNSEILNFYWVTGAEVLFVTSLGLELYQVEFDKKTLKYLKCVSISVNWFHYHSKTNFILLSSGPSNNQLQPFYISDCTFNKLPRLEVESSPFQKQIKPATILERDVILTACYSQTRVLIFQHSQSPSFSGTDIAVYTLSKTMAPKKTHTLKLHLCGRFAVNIVDDLIVVHHQISKSSFIFDINLSARDEDSVSVLKPIMEHMPISTPSDIECELYSSHWVTFQPNIIIDVGIGAFWYLNLNLDIFLKQMKDKSVLTDFLLQRTNGRDYLIKMLNDVLSSENRNLENIAALFNRLNIALKDKQELEMQSQIGQPVSYSVTVQIYKPLRNVKIVLKQFDMYTYVFTKIADTSSKQSSQKKTKFFIWILLEYVRSLTDYNIHVDHCINELLINTLVFNECFLELHQILQYHVISDSKPLACHLLSLKGRYPPAHQLALDMMHRISNSTEEITEVLLSNQDVISAIRYRDTYGSESEISFRKYLDVALEEEKTDVFYSVFVELEKRDKNNARSQFTRGGFCDVYIDKFNKWYRSKAVSELVSMYDATIS